MSGQPPLPASHRRILLASLVGTSVEFYDFYIYATAAVLVFPKLFFPQSDPLTGVLLSFLTFGVGFVPRPLGGLVFGHFGDKYGRKHLLQVSIILVGVSTFAMGLIPPFSMIGYAAPVILVLLRFAQGFAVGGGNGACHRFGAIGRGGVGKGDRGPFTRQPFHDGGADAA